MNRASLKSNFALTLIETLVVVIIVGLLAGMLILKRSHDYEKGVVYSKREMTNSVNKMIEIQYIKGYALDIPFLTNTIIVNSPDPSVNFDSVARLLQAFASGQKNDSTFYPAVYYPPITNDSFQQMLNNLQSARYREHIAATGHFLLVGTDHKTLQLVYVPGTTE